MRTLSTLISLIAVFPLSALSQTWQREAMTFEKVEAMAKDLAAKPYVAPSENSLPDWMNDLTYDQYRDIRFNPEKALWSEEDSPFRAMFFHPGYLFRRPVELWEFTDTHQQRVRLSGEFFNYGPLIENHGELPAEAGFAGFRLHAPLNSEEYFDELIVFQGASYWRALGKNQRYGISARGVAVNTGLSEVPEEFPDFRAFWLRKPSPADSFAQVFALLDGPSISGAFEFRIRPGEDTQIDVRLVLFPRQEIARLGIAPMSSMFWFGENSRRRFDDFRPEVHDSDGLAIRTGSDERIWRSASNDSGKLEFSFYRDDSPKGFGLLQRDRRLVAYEDEEANYHMRPSLWIEPIGAWGGGSVMLMEIPTGNELADNLVAMWIPEKKAEPGERLEFSYRQFWTLREDPSQAQGRVVATRTGVHDWQPGERTVIVEFVGDALDVPSLDEEKNPQPIEPIIEAMGENAEKISFRGVNLQKLQDDRFRLSFQIVPSSPDEKLEQIGPVELRASLHRGDDYLTETWSYRLAP